MATKVMRTRQVCDNLRDAAGLHGSGIDGAVIGAYQTILIEVDTNQSPHDGWVKIVGPNPPINPDGTYLRYGRVAWVELAHLEEVNADLSVIRLEIDWANKSVRLL